MTISTDKEYKAIYWFVGIANLMEIIHSLMVYNTPDFLFDLFLITFIDLSMLAYSLAIWKTLILDKDGITVILWNRKRTYAWNDLAIKRWEKNYPLNGAPYKEGFFFSVKKVKKSPKFDPLIYCMFKHPFTCFFVYLVPPDEKRPKRRDPDVMAIEKEAFFNKLNEWEIEFTES